MLNARKLLGKLSHFASVTKILPHFDDVNDDADTSLSFH